MKSLSSISTGGTQNLDGCSGTVVASDWVKFKEWMAWSICRLVMLECIPPFGLFGFWFSPWAATTSISYARVTLDVIVFGPKCHLYRRCCTTLFNSFQWSVALVAKWGDAPWRCLLPDLFLSTVVVLYFSHHCTDNYVTLSLIMFVPHTLQSLVKLFMWSCTSICKSKLAVSFHCGFLGGWFPEAVSSKLFNAAQRLIEQFKAWILSY